MMTDSRESSCSSIDPQINERAPYRCTASFRIATRAANQAIQLSTLLISIVVHPIASAFFAREPRCAPCRVTLMRPQKSGCRTALYAIAYCFFASSHLVPKEDDHRQEMSRQQACCHAQVLPCRPAGAPVPLRRSYWRVVGSPRFQLSGHVLATIQAVRHSTARQPGSLAGLECGLSWLRICAEPDHLLRGRSLGHVQFSSIDWASSALSWAVDLVQDLLSSHQISSFDLLQRHLSTYLLQSCANIRCLMKFAPQQLSVTVLVLLLLSIHNVQYLHLHWPAIALFLSVGVVIITETSRCAVRRACDSMMWRLQKCIAASNEHTSHSCHQSQTATPGHRNASQLGINFARYKSLCRRRRLH